MASTRSRIDGNLFTRVAYQMNMPAEELSRAELDHVDEGHPLLISVRAVKPMNWQRGAAGVPRSLDPDRHSGSMEPSTGHYPEHLNF